MLPMRRFVLTVFFLTVFFLSSILSFASATQAEVQIGASAPQFTASDVHGVNQSLDQYKGKIIVLEWTNPECPYVVKHYQTGNMQQLQKKYVGLGVVWLTINSSGENKQGNLSTEEAKNYLSEKAAMPTAYLFDPSGTIGKSYGAKTTPHMFIINSAGTVAYAGAIDDNSSSRHSSVENARNFVAEALDALLADQPVQTASTKAYGCSVKYSS